MQKLKPGFTLIELMVAVAILTVVLTMGAAATSYTVGQLRSKKTLDINTPIRNAFDIISQKMNTANGKIKGTRGPIYGFRAANNTHVLTIVNDGTCTKIGRFGDALMMKQFTDSGTCNNDGFVEGEGQPITPVSVKVTSFTLEDVSYMDQDTATTISKIPRVTVKIKAEDPDDASNSIDVQTSYYLDFETVNSLKNL